MFDFVPTGFPFKKINFKTRFFFFLTELLAQLLVVICPTLGAEKVLQLNFQFNFCEDHKKIITYCRSASPWPGTFEDDSTDI